MKTHRAQVTGDAQGRDMVIAQLDSRYFEEFINGSTRGLLLGGGPLDATNEIAVGGVVWPVRCIPACHANFTYREPAA